MNKIMVFVKAPVPGRVKTRLVPPLSPRQAARLYIAFVKDTLAAARGAAAASPLRALGAASSQVDIFYDSSADFPDLSWLDATKLSSAASVPGPKGPGLDAEPPPPFFSQKGTDLGMRLKLAFDETLSRGAGKAVAIGSDTPHIAPAVLSRAFSSLERADVILGPAADGGYYLIGLKEPCGFLFQGISWSTADVLRQTLERAKQRGLKTAALPTLFDVDAISDLRKLAGFLAVNGAGSSRFTKLALDELSGQGVIGDAVKH